MALLLSMTTMIYGLNVARSIIQEKTSRIFEVMLATVKPGDMLAGKLIGVGAVGLTQILIWVVAGVAICLLALRRRAPDRGTAVHFSWTEGILFPVYFLLGYLLYSSFFAGLAATCETEQELQMYMPLAAAPTWLSFALIILVINDSNSPWSILASLFPPTAPIIMFLRMASEIPPLWQIGLSLCAHGGQHLGDPLVLLAPLSHRNPHVRQARHSARTDPLAALQLENSRIDNVLKGHGFSCAENLPSRMNGL